jgi:hypothetical protein
MGTTFANDYLKFVFNATPIANMADNAATSPHTQYYLALHTADPGAGGNQTTNEIAYTSYARAAVARTTGGFTVASNAVALAAAVSFPAGTGGSGTATYWSVGTAASGTGKVLYSGQITTPSGGIVCGNTITPQLGTGTTITVT